MIQTDVLVVGSGPAGSGAAALLSTYGVENILVTKYRWLADTPRAHITNQRTMEVLRDLGLEQEAMLYATPNHLMGNNVFCTSLAGEELGRMRSWGADPFTQARHRLASPTTMVDLPQDLLEPIPPGLFPFAERSDRDEERRRKAGGRKDAACLQRVVRVAIVEGDCHVAA